MLKNVKVIFIVAALVAVAFAGFKLLKPADDAALSATPSSDNVGEAGIGGTFLSKLLELKTLKLEDSLFASPAFMALEDMSVPLPEQPVGRRNPFAPLSGAPAPDTTAAGANVRAAVR